MYLTLLLIAAFAALALKMGLGGIDLNNDKTYDQWKTTLSSYDTAKDSIAWAFDRQRFPFIQKVWPQRQEEPGGTDIKRQVVYTDAGAFQWILPGEPRVRSTGNIVAEWSMPWAAGFSSHSMLASEIRRNQSIAQLKNLAKIRRGNCYVNIFKGMETMWWGLPDTSGNKKAAGAPYWFPCVTATQIAAGTGAGAHQGQNAYGFSATGGIDRSDATYANLRSWAGAWTNSSGNIAEEDLRRLGRMFMSLDFQIPDEIDAAKKPKYGNWGAETTLAVYEGYAAAMRYRNEDFGTNPMRGYGGGLTPEGRPIFCQMPLGWAKELDNTAADVTILSYRGYNPLYFINYNYVFPYVEKGMALKEDVLPRDKAVPDRYDVDVNLSIQTLVENPQIAGGVMSYPLTTPGTAGAYLSL